MELPTGITTRETTTPSLLTDEENSSIVIYFQALTLYKKDTLYYINLLLSNLKPYVTDLV